MEFSPSRIIDWLQTCDRDHEGCYYLPDNSIEPYNFWEEVQSNFRLLDVELGCVKIACLGERYIALSYVCNLPSMFTLRKDNAERLYAEGYLERIRRNLPKTINDAIDLVKAIGERYLWVDALCLIGDDECDIALGIRMMNSIFQGSYFTIVAASGVDANAGLWEPGSETEEVEEQISKVGIGLEVTDVQSLSRYLSKSEYNKKAWTLQEFALSRRALIFINDRVFFRCQTAGWGETYEAGLSRIPDQPDGKLPSIAAYIELFEEYSRRELRYDGDALRGFYGIIRPLFMGMRARSVEGLPAYYVNAFILFTSPDANLRRRHEFASFSWAGWAGELKWPRENLVWYDKDGQRTQSLSNIFKWLKRNEIAEWNQIEELGNLHHISQSKRARVDSNFVELLREYPHLFDDETVDARRWYNDWYSNGRFSGPVWQEDIAKTKNPNAYKRKDRPQLFMEALVTLNSQAEYNRLIKRMDWGRSDDSVRCWNSSYRAYIRILQASSHHECEKDVKLLGHDWSPALRPNTAVSAYTRARGGRDRRLSAWERHVARPPLERRHIPGRPPARRRPRIPWRRRAPVANNFIPPEPP
ncbi:hypothetical protein V495_04313 [Pseudogymnoascus sp. VKM F-4514 (FW-929)]|nr:hypothetical protein V495_04313 [Pseudogymnoascus sp. VKM F-4514 (FW-929)]KFY66659.1 hypothetical protein V497_00808 [Pseudogymnoascus sp. VKM F-4516 (FW-969)]